MFWIVLLAMSALLLLLASNGVGAGVTLGGKEKPGRIVGANVLLSEFDGFGASPPTRIEATVQQFVEGGRYRLVFSTPQLIGGRKEAYATVSARHSGYPVSSAGKRRVIAVAGEMQSGAPFIALIHRPKRSLSEA